MSFVSYARNCEDVILWRALRILYHRCGEKQTTRSEKALPALRTIRAAPRAVREHLDALGTFQLESVFCEYKNADPVKRQRGVREWQDMHQSWGAMLEAGDPFQNPNLLFEGDHLEIPSAPRRLKAWRIASRSASEPDHASRRI